MCVCSEDWQTNETIKTILTCFNLIYFKKDECHQWLGKVGSANVRVPSPTLQEDMGREMC